VSDIKTSSEWVPAALSNYAILRSAIESRLRADGHNPAACHWQLAGTDDCPHIVVTLPAAIDDVCFMCTVHVPAAKCECGVTATGVGGLHSSWCPLA
jgi:hypothetical protein